MFEAKLDIICNNLILNVRKTSKNYKATVNDLRPKPIIKPSNFHLQPNINQSCQKYAKLYKSIFSVQSAQ